MRTATTTSECKSGPSPVAGGGGAFPLGTAMIVKSVKPPIWIFSQTTDHKHSSNHLDLYINQILFLACTVLDQQNFVCIRETEKLSYICLL